MKLTAHGMQGADCIAQLRRMEQDNLRGVPAGFDRAYAARLAGAGVICLYALTTPIHAASPIGKVFAKSGSPSASGPGGNRGLAPGSPPYEDDEIVTGSGNVQIIFIDNTKLVVAPNSTLVIDRFVMRGGNRARACGAPDECS